MIKRGNTGQYQALYDVPAFVVYNLVKHRGIIPVYTPRPTPFREKKLFGETHLQVKFNIFHLY